MRKVMMLMILTGIVVANLTAQNGVPPKTGVEDSCAVILPTAFTPNNDGLNDQARILCKCELDYSTLEVYNRWGDLIFSSEDRNQGWDGTVGGALQPNGSYIWVVRYARSDNDETTERVRSGTLALLR